jgi:hypothetical protein
MSTSFRLHPSAHRSVICLSALGREEAAAEAARQEKAIEEYAAAKREQEGQHDARRAANREVADRYGPDASIPHATVMPLVM